MKKKLIILALALFVSFSVAISQQGCDMSIECGGGDEFCGSGGCYGDQEVVVRADRLE